MVVADGRLGATFAAPDDANRCVALAQPMPQSDRQQARVCLTEAHRDCPRYGLGFILRRAVADPAGNSLAGIGATTTPAAAAGTTMATAASGTRAGPAPSRTDSTVLTPAVLAATALLVLSAVASIAFVLIRGGLTLQ